MTQARPLELHSPAPRSRPGDRPDFGDLMLSPAGAVRRPEVTAAESDMRDLAFGLVRVLDDQGRAAGPWTPSLGPEALHRGLRAMMLTRAFDDRMFNAHRQGKASFYVKSTGEEAIGAAQSQVLSPGDMCFPTYRMASWLIDRGYPLSEMFNFNFSNKEDPLQGRQLPTLYSAKAFGFYSISGNLGSRFGHAVGWAMASAYTGDT